MNDEPNSFFWNIHISNENFPKHKTKTISLKCHSESSNYIQGRQEGDTKKRRPGQFKTADQMHAFWHRFHLTKKGKRAGKRIPKNTYCVWFTYWFERTVFYCVNLVSRWPWSKDVLDGHNVTFQQLRPQLLRKRHLGQNHCRLVLWWADWRTDTLQSGLKNKTSSNVNSDRKIK